MVGSVVQRDLKIYNGITRENARIQRALDTCVNSGDKLLRDRAADYPGAYIPGVRELTAGL